jgi:site-specific recombinase XerD
MLPESEKQHAFLTPDETIRFLNAFQHAPSFRISYFGLMTGLRPKELTYLEWKDIDIEMKTAKITSKPPLFVIKDKQERAVQLNKAAMSILKEILADKPDNQYVFVHKGKPIKSIRRSIDTAAKRAGITKKMTPNMLRHTFATHAVMKGADIKSVQALLGHANIATTQKYVHAVEEQLKKTVKLLENILDKVPTFTSTKKGLHKL